MQAVRPPQSQNARRRRGPKIEISLDADVCRRKQCPPPKAKAPEPAKPKERFVPKIHLSYIPPALRRPVPRLGLLSDWLATCQPKKADEDGETTCSSRSNCSSSGASSGGTITTDFSSVSSPRNAPEATRSDLAQHQPLAVQPPPTRKQYPYRIPTTHSRAQELSPAQWAELLLLQQASIKPKQHHPPPKLMNIHTVYLPELDAAVRDMMQLQPAAEPAPMYFGSYSPPPLPMDFGSYTPPPMDFGSYSPPSLPSQPWQQRDMYYDNIHKRSPMSPPSISSGTTADSAHGSEGYGRRQVFCTFCYEHAVHEANSKIGSHLPRVDDKGYWRGHVLREGAIIVCPRLLRRICALCGATGQLAHQSNYCPVTKKMTSRY